MTHSYNFKLIFTCITIRLDINLNDTIENVINKVKNHILNSNNLTFMHDASDFEIISTSSVIDLYPNELEYKIISSLDNFINTYEDSISFYIRPMYQFNNNIYYLLYNDNYNTKFLIKYFDVLRIRLGEINIFQLIRHDFMDICYQENNSIDRITNHLNDVSNNSSSTSSIQVLELVDHQCFICYENNNTLQCYHQCMHLSCAECNNRCILNNILSCGICRSN